MYPPTQCVPPIIIAHPSGPVYSQNGRLLQGSVCYCVQLHEAQLTLTIKLTQRRSHGSTSSISITASVYVLSNDRGCGNRCVTVTKVRLFVLRSHDDHTCQFIQSPTCKREIRVYASSDTLVTATNTTRAQQ